MKAQETEKEVLTQYAEVEGVVSATVLQEISQVPTFQASSTVHEASAPAAGLQPET